MYGEYFVKEQKLAYNLWNVILNIGLVIQFSISTALCVYAKIYLQIALLCLAVTTYGEASILVWQHKEPKIIIPMLFSS